MSDSENKPLSGRTSPAPLTQTLAPDVPERSSRTSQMKLSTELSIKMRTQLGRLDTIQEIITGLPTTHEDTSVDDLDLIIAQLKEIHTAFLADHSYFEKKWPASMLDHEYFSQNVHGQESRLILEARRAVNKLKPALTGSLIPEMSQEKDSRFNSRLPDIALPTFKGDYSSWPTFSELFTCLILDNTRLMNVEKLHYLRGCMDGSPAQLISSLPLTGDSLQPSWEILTKRYENRRLIVQAHLDRMHDLSPSSHRDAASLNKLISTISESTKALQSIGIGDTLGDCMLVHLVTRHLDRTTCEQWETSLGGSQDYPKFSQLEAFLTARARALEHIESSHETANSSHQRTQPPVTKKSTAHQASAQTPQPSTSFSSISQAASTNYSCNCCNASHFIVTCARFFNMTPGERLRMVIERRLCFNCLGRHNVRSCRSSRGCKKCNDRYHTMLHDAHPLAPSTSTSAASSSRSQSTSH